MHFLNGLKADARKYVEDNAPEGWWTDPQSLFDKALQYEVNQNSKLAKVQQQPRIDTTQVKIRQVRAKSRERSTNNGKRPVYTGSQGYGQQNMGRGAGRGRGPIAGPSRAPMASYGRGRNMVWPPKMYGPIVPQQLRESRINAGLCLTCGADPHSYSECTQRECVYPARYDSPIISLFYFTLF